MEKKYKISHFQEYCDKTYNKIKNYIKNIKDYFNNSLNLCDLLLKQIEIYKSYLEKLDYNSLDNPDDLKNNEFFEGLKTEYDLFNEQITKNNNLSESIVDEINNIITFNFFPQDESTLKINSYLAYQDNYSENFSSFLNYVDNKNISNNINSNEEVENDEENKNNFLNSIENIIKYILMKCNDILIEIETNKNNSVIRKIINYPKIRENQNDYVDFLKEINEIDKDNLNISNFNKYKLNNDIVKRLENIYKQNMVLNLIINPENSNFDDDDDESGEFINEVCDGKSEKSDEKEYEREVIDEKVLNNYYYFINIISKDNLKRNENISIKFLHKLNINPENFLASSNTKYFIDNFVRTKNFINLSLEQIKSIYPNLEDLYEYKNIVDYLINECSIKDYIDCRGNFIIKINNKDETKERYYPPYEWIGIGLNVIGKYENDEWLLDDSKDSKWAIAYHGVGGRLPIKLVKDKLIKKIKEGLKQGRSQTKCHSDDIRHPGKRIGTGVYLTPNINIAENYSGIICINKERYKVALMAKVRIDKIRESKDINFWILNSKYIRVYRILLKKFNK